MKGIYFPKFLDFPNIVVFFLAITFENNMTFWGLVLFLSFSNFSRPFFDLHLTYTSHYFFPEKPFVLGRNWLMKKSPTQQRNVRKNALIGLI